MTQRLGGEHERRALVLHGREMWLLCNAPKKQLPFFPNMVTLTFFRRL
jgi:hypothetical protein